jgi:hypothetical protein
LIIGTLQANNKPSSIPPYLAIELDTYPLPVVFPTEPAQGTSHVVTFVLICKDLETLQSENAPIVQDVEYNRRASMSAKVLKTTGILQEELALLKKLVKSGKFECKILRLMIRSSLSTF